MMRLRDYFNKMNAPQGAERSSSQATDSVNHIGQFVNRVLRGDCIDVMKHFPSNSIGFSLNDPPYLVNYAKNDRQGRGYENDNPQRPWWIAPAFTEIYRVLKPDSFCLSFYGWPQGDEFIKAWKSVGFRPVAHFTFIKEYPSAEGYVKMHHEQAYLLAKGKPFSQHKIPDVQPFYYTGNRMHPTEKSPDTLRPIIQAFSKSEDIVLDAFAGSGSTLEAAQREGRKFIGIELSPEYAQVAADRVVMTNRTYLERL
jgi:DNA modification methylase